MTTLLTNADQLKSASLLQLGSDNHPCTVVFGTSNFDDGKAYRAIKIECPEIDLISEFDLQAEGLHPIVKEYREQKFVTIKISEDTVMPCELTGLTRGTLVVVIIRPMPWSMSGKKGISLRCEALKIVKKEKEIFNFI